MSLQYSVITQTAAEVQQGENSPATSIWPYLLNTAQTQLLNQISVYTGKGKTHQQLRFLYMNATALQIWKDMGREVTIIGEVKRPPMTALLSFGMPFGE